MLQLGGGCCLVAGDMVVVLVVVAFGLAEDLNYCSPLTTCRIRDFVGKEGIFT